jgi:hypothetical protein
MPVLSLSGHEVNDIASSGRATSLEEYSVVSGLVIGYAAAAARQHALELRGFITT